MDKFWFMFPLVPAVLELVKLGQIWHYGSVRYLEPNLFILGTELVVFSAIFLITLVLLISKTLED